MRLLAGSLCAAFLAALTQGPPLQATASCDSLASLALPNVTITLAREIAAGAFTPPTAGPADGSETSASQGGFNRLLAFCRVAATLKPSSDSDIRIELWMPAANWNGKFQAVGNGAFNGSISYPAMMAALERGYATSSTDTGHTGNGASFALGHPEKLIDFGWRAVHEMTVTSKKIIGAYYEAAPRLSYWTGCSAGGRQALKEAQRFPADFDGIVAGAPGLDWTGRASQAVRGAQALRNEAARLTPAKAQALHAAVLDACDALDGTKDKLIADPTQCTFNPETIQCKGPDDESCLTRAQVETAKMLYSPLVNSRTKRETAGLQRGSELGWTNMGWTSSARATGRDQFRFIVFKDPNWDLDHVDADADLARADEADGDTINVLDPNLKPFIARGGKLIQYHGWNDPQISPGNSVQYHQRAMTALKGVARVEDSYRLFMVPGMGHCRGGEGPSSFDMLGALEQWVERGNAPAQIIASHLSDGRVDRTRPLCPYPQVAAYKGSGSIEQAENFVCKTP